MLLYYVGINSYSYRRRVTVSTRQVVALKKFPTHINIVKETPLSMARLLLVVIA